MLIILPDDCNNITNPQNHLIDKQTNKDQTISPPPPRYLHVHAATIGQQLAKWFHTTGSNFKLRSFEEVRLNRVSLFLRFSFFKFSVFVFLIILG